METQLKLAMMNDELGQARTSKKEFPDKIESIIPWDKFIEIIEPCYYKGERGNKPYPLELMLRIFLLQNLYDLADMRVMTEVIDSRAFSEFCGVTSPEDVPDGDTIGRFRNLLEKNGIQEKIFASVVKILEERVGGDSGYLGADKRKDAVKKNKAGKKIKYNINRRPSSLKQLSRSGQYYAKKKEHEKSSVRCKVEHVFAIVKRLFRYRKTRYRGLRKQTAKLNIMFALANLYLADRKSLTA